MIKIDEDINKGTCALHPYELKHDIAMEELSELQKAISKMTRARCYPERGKTSANYKDDINSCRVDMAEEIADVLLVIETLKELDGVTDASIQGWVDYKQTRQCHRDLLELNDIHKEYIQKKEELDSPDDLSDEEWNYFYTCKERLEENGYEEPVNEGETEETVSE